MSLDAQVATQEHPELDNPLARARGDVEGFSVQLAEAQTIFTQMQARVVAAQQALDAANIAVVEARRDATDVNIQLDAAKQHLAQMEGA